MNSEEGTSLAKMAVSIILVVLVIGAIIFLVFQAYNWFNSGTAKLTDKVNSIDSSAYSNFDDKNVSGTDALTTLKQFRDADFAIIIVNDNAMWNYCALLTGAKGCKKDATDASDAKEIVGYYVDKTNGGVDTDIYLQDKSQCSLDWTTGNGKTKRNTNFSITVDKGSEAYVNPRDMYHARLIYDNTTKDVCGICMVKIGGDKQLEAGSGS